MSDSRHLLGELPDGAKWHQWQMNEIQPANDKPLSTEAKAASAPPEVAAKQVGKTEKAPERPTPEQIEQQARDRGYKAGYTAGHREGSEASFEEAREKGYEKGLAEGRQTAKEEFSRQAKHNLKFLIPLAENFANAIGDMEQEIAADLVDLALSIGERLALETLQAKPQAVLKVVREVMKADVNPAGRPVLVVHPADLWLVEEHLGEELDHLGWQIRGDDSLTRGGCLVRSNNCELDATWEARWQALTSRMRQRRPAEPPASETARS